MVIVLIRRCVKADKEAEFLKSYRAQKPTHVDFIDETLTKLRDDQSLPPEMRNLELGCEEGCATYINVARWCCAESFQENFRDQLQRYDPNVECSPRLRAVLTVVNPQMGF